MIPWIALAAVSAASPTVPLVDTRALLKDASQAMEAGRLEQARLMTERATAAGATGASVDRLLADLAYASEDYSQALTRYQPLLANAPADPALLEHAGIAALKIGDLERASGLLDRAASNSEASWRVWNALGVIADMGRDWESADKAYQRALDRAPERAEVVNNLGWSHLLRGNWSTAVENFGRAAALDPNFKRIANNLELARTALAAELPKRREGESDDAWAYRLNDAGVAAEILGDKPRAIAAFSRALEASDLWYARAANNLEAVSR